MSPARPRPARPQGDHPEGRPTASARDEPAGSTVAAALAVTPQGVLHLDVAPPADSRLPAGAAEALLAAFTASPARGLLHLGSALLDAELPPSLAFGRELARLFLAQLAVQIAAQVGPEDAPPRLALPPPEAELVALTEAAPPMTGAEYLTRFVLQRAWIDLVEAVEGELSDSPGGARDYLARRAPAFAAVGRVHFHLAENKRDERAPFAFLATYATRLSDKARVQHAPLGRALTEYAGAHDKGKLLALLQPVQRAAEGSGLIKELVGSGEIFHPLAWTPREAFAFLQEVPACEAGGVVVRVPDWWKRKRPPHPEVKITVGGKKPAGLGMDALLDFNVGLSLDGEPISAAEMKELLAGKEPLVLLKGKWVEVDRARLQEVLDHWRSVEQRARHEGISFLEGMRLLAGADLGGKGGGAATASADTAWTQVTAGPWLAELLADLQRPEGSREADPGDALHGSLRPYQRAGVAWLRLLARLGLGACLADDMGLGKTIQVLALLLVLRREGAQKGARRGGARPSLVVAPASLLGNWRAEAARFAPDLRVLTAHPSAMSRADLAALPAADLAAADLVLTTYGTAARVPWFAERPFGVVVLDEAQAIKNPDTKQARAVKALRSEARVALTGTPVENRLGDLWSIFDFLNPGLLGSAKAFSSFAKKLEADPKRGFAPLRTLTRPYLLRRMKSDKSIVPDLPDKTEVVAFCALTRTQAALYEQSVAELAATIDNVEGIQRRGLVLAYLVRFKQICNHPSQWLGDGAYRPEESGKLTRLRELCEPLAERQDKVLVFTQFREMTGPLASFLAGIFGRPGLVLHGETPVKKRPELVAEFQEESGPPFFVLSLKAGGTGLNLSAASHVVHFDRWWNPAVENQATDRAYRIGQKKNVLVHKLCCRGTIEERIDALIAGKRRLSEEILAGAGEGWLTELPRDELLRLVSLDLQSALEEG